MRREVVSEIGVGLAGAFGTVLRVVARVPRQAGHPPDQDDRRLLRLHRPHPRKWVDQGYPLCPHGQPMREQ